LFVIPFLLSTKLQKFSIFHFQVISSKDGGQNTPKTKKLSMTVNGVEKTTTVESAGDTTEEDSSLSVQLRPKTQDAKESFEIIRHVDLVSNCHSR
jgi:hypothetical protein